MKRLLVSYLRYILYSFVQLFVIKKNTQKKQYHAIIRLDAIGDFLLFRNCIQPICQSNEYKDKQFIFIGNELWKELFEIEDQQYFYHCIWINRDKFDKNLWYRYKKLNEVRGFTYDEAISPIYSQDYFHTDWVLKTMHANKKIASKFLTNKVETWMIKNSKSIYTQFIDTYSFNIFEFERNKLFTEILIHQQLQIKQPYFNQKNFSTGLTLSQNYVSIFIGASHPSKMWNIQNFIEVADYIQSKYKLPAIFIGKSSAQNIDLINNKGHINYVNQTNLIDLLVIIKNSKLLISHDSCAPHIAVSVGMSNMIVLYNGLHYGRFLPYPEHMSKQHIVYHPSFDSNNSNERSIHLKMDQIKSSQVNEVVDTILKLSS